MKLADLDLFAVDIWTQQQPSVFREVGATIGTVGRMHRVNERSLFAERVQFFF